MATGSDQTVGDTISVANFENLDASILTTALTVVGSAAANTITTGSGNDTIDGGGGADVINAGGGNDTAFYYGAETSIDGGTGTNTLILRARPRSTWPMPIRRPAIPPRSPISRTSTRRR